MSANCKPLTMGGDHFVTYPILRAIADKHGPVKSSISPITQSEKKERIELTFRPLSLQTELINKQGPSKFVSFCFRWH